MKESKERSSKRILGRKMKLSVIKQKATFTVPIRIRLMIKSVFIFGTHTLADEF